VSTESLWSRFIVSLWGTQCREYACYNCNKHCITFLYVLSGTPKLFNFDYDVTALTTYQEKDYQPLYFVTESIDETI